MLTPPATNHRPQQQPQVLCPRMTLEQITHMVNSNLHYHLHRAAISHAKCTTSTAQEYCTITFKTATVIIPIFQIGKLRH